MCSISWFVLPRHSKHVARPLDSKFAKALTADPTDVVIQKGTNQYVDAYSAFMDNSRSLRTALDSELQAAEIDTLYVAGIATDVCVKWTVRDALSSLTGNYTVKVISDASAGIYAGTGTTSAADADKWFVEQGASIVSTSDVLAMECPHRSIPISFPSVSVPASSASLFVLVLSMYCTLVASSILW